MWISRRALLALFGFWILVGCSSDSIESAETPASLPLAESVETDASAPSNSSAPSPTTAALVPSVSVPLVDEDTREVVSFSLPSSPDALANALTLQSRDIEGVVFDVLTPAEEICVDVPSVHAAHPPTASSDVFGQNGHDVMSAALVYESPEAAVDALAYLEGAVAECTGALLSDVSGAEAVGYYALFDPAPHSDGSVQIGYSAEFTTEERTLSLAVEGTVVEDVLLLVGSTDDTMVRSAIELVALRATGVDLLDGLVLSGEPLVGPGFGDAEYWSWPVVGPLEVRDAAGDDALAWATSLADGELDDFSALACAESWAVDSADALGIWNESMSASLAISGRTDGSALLDLVMTVYCPGLAEVVSQTS